MEYARGDYLELLLWGAITVGTVYAFNELTKEDYNTEKNIPRVESYLRPVKPQYLKPENSPESNIKDSRKEKREVYF